MAFHKPAPGGLDVTVRVTPRGGRDAVDGVAELADGRSVLKVRVRAAPEDGAATTAAGRALAEAAGVAPSHVKLLSGATARVKVFRISGDGAALVRALEQRAGVAG